ncbi:uncharacterized protein LOC142320270 [Lycorma delicatula]|uniref:uncharacterized protein LOC142320270 n=1 Tax=Lycorma delicatula TaxID=130591 RepID=UPI003F51044E
MPQEIDFLNEARYHLQTDNSLLINSIEENDSGLYSCQENINQKDSEKVYAYYIDVVMVELYDQGNTENWKAYVQKFIIPMKEKFLQSENEEYIYLRNILRVQMNIVSEWEKQQACDGCTQISKRKAFCRLRPTHKEKMDEENINLQMLTIKRFLSIYQLSCHSLQLSALFPKIAKDLSNIPNFLIVSHCKGQCQVSSGIHQAKYHDYYNLKEYAHLILTCPETTATSQVIWLKNGEQLKARSNKSSRIEVDIFGTLSLSGIAWSDEGNYSCFVDSVHMQDVIIKIKSSFSDNTEFFWQNVCIGIILWFNLILFCAGLTIKCKRRHQYKTLDEILEEEDLERKKKNKMF